MQKNLIAKFRVQSSSIQWPSMEGLFIVRMGS